MFASDIDGTLLGYDDLPGEEPAINFSLIRRIRERTDKLALVTNQGGLPFGVMGAVRRDGQRYPTPEDFVGRLAHLGEACIECGLFLTGLYVCTFHPKATPEAVYFAAEAVDDLLFGKPWHWLSVHVYPGEIMRKPSPAMLQAAKATRYYGDSDEDAQAALGIEFVRVERFFRQQT